MEIKILEKFNNYTVFSYIESFHISKHLINEWNNNKKIKLNGKIVNLNSLMKTNDLLTLDIDEEVNMIPYKNHLDIIYEDDYMIAVKKEQGILIHDDGNTYETLTNIVYNYLSKAKKHPFVYPVHRIDFDTTGIVLFAKNRLSLAYLSVEIESHNFIKEYVCLCHNKFKKLSGTIEKNIGKDRHSNKQIVVNSGKEAKSSYEVINNNKISKVKVVIEHGRRHQIRVHLASINHPIVGDEIYGIEDNATLKLHFKKLILTHPYTREKLIIECEEEF